MTQDIKLPPLPSVSPGKYGFHSSDMQDYARSAIELDRQGRSEPVYQANYRGQGWQDTSLSRFNYLSDDPESGKENWNLRVLYTAPQPADPAVKDSLTVAEPVKSIYAAVEAYQLAERACFDHHLTAGNVIEPAIAVEAGLLAAAPFLAEPAQEVSAQPAASVAPIKRNIRGVIHGLQGSIAVGSDGEWVSIRRDARDEAIQRLRDLSYDCAHMYESYRLATERAGSVAAQPSVPDPKDYSTLPQLYVNGWNDCRAAMLASAPPAAGPAIDWEAMYDQMCERCDYLDGKLAEYEAKPASHATLRDLIANDAYAASFPTALWIQHYLRR